MATNKKTEQIKNQKAISKKSFGQIIINNAALTALVILMILFTIVNERFLTTNNMINILTQVSVTAIIAFGMTFVITAAQIDLSVGSILALAGMIFMALSVAGVPVFWGIIITLAVGGFIGGYYWRELMEKAPQGSVASKRRAKT